MQSFWSPIVKTLTPYTAGEQSEQANLVKLNTNENPYPPSPKVSECLRNFQTDTLRLYPDPEATRLKHAIAKVHGIDSRYVFVGNGSDEVLAHTFCALLKHDKPLLMPDITYSFYPVYCQLFNINFDTVALNAHFEIDIADYRRPSAAVILANPNAPTGRLLSLTQIEQLLCQNRQRLVVVDEAYIDFGGQTAAALCQHYANLLVIQTFSKSRSLAALRIGYAIGQPHLIEALNRVKNSFNSYPLSRIAIDCAIAALQDSSYFSQCITTIIQQRQWLSQELVSRGFTCLESSANFIFCHHAKAQANDLYLALKQENILVRHFNKPRIDNFLRISIGSEPQNQALLAALDKILGS